MQRVDTIDYKPNRLLFWDIVKGIAILFVIMGHQIQYSCGWNDDFIDDPFFKFIYGFHMPLFMFLSGFFFYYSTSRHSISYIIRRRFCQCIIPVATITILVQLSKKVTSPLVIFYSFVSSSYWFLWALFILSLLVLLTKQKPIFSFIVIFISTFFLPNKWLLEYIAFMYPYFVVGYLFNNYQLLDRIIGKQLFSITFCLGVCYVFLLFFFKKETYIYWSHYSVLNENSLHQVFLNLQRMLTGFCGLFFIICLIRLTYNYYYKIIQYILVYLGKNTLQLYVISTLPIFMLIEIHFSFNKVSYFLAFLSFLFVTSTSLVIIEFLKKNAITNFLFFGEIHKQLNK